MKFTEAWQALQEGYHIINPLISGFLCRNSSGEVYHIDGISSYPLSVLSVALLNSVDWGIKIPDTQLERKFCFSFGEALDHLVRRERVSNERFSEGEYISLEPRKGGEGNNLVYHYPSGVSTAYLPSVDDLFTRHWFLYEE